MVVVVVMIEMIEFNAMFHIICETYCSILLFRSE